MAGSSETLRRYGSYLRYGAETFLLGRTRPYLFILVINDACNLSCFYCTTRNTGMYDLDFGTATKLLKLACGRGHRALVLTGGEPMLWQSDGRRLEDVVAVATELGFLDIAVFTNGTLPLGIEGCRYIVTIDGTREVHESIRPGTYDTILEHARAARGKVMASVTLTKANAPHLEATVESIATAGCFEAITFNLLTHRPEVLKRLGISGEERQELLGRIWRLKRRGYPILLSRAAFDALRANSWKRPIQQIELGTKQQVFKCCRDVVHPEVCENCGYSSCVEIAETLRGRPSALLEMFRVIR